MCQDVVKNLWWQIQDPQFILDKIFQKSYI